ncbi:MAG: LexA family transcriptional regulator [Clostridia bacterium]|nr:LexA family transcriptional regulator [Clostridia bacterium]
MLTERMKTLREQRAVSQKDLAAALQVAQSAVGNWESGARQPNLDRIRQIAAFFGVSVGYLLGTEDQPTPTPGRPLIPVLGYVRAGLPITATEEVLDFEEISRDMADAGSHFALRVQGDSMEPYLLEGDVVIVRQQEDVDSGDMAVILIGGEDATVKKLVKHDNGVALVAANPKYAPMFFTTEEVQSIPVSVVGKVVELRRKL